MTSLRYFCAASSSSAITSSLGDCASKRPIEVSSMPTTFRMVTARRRRTPWPAHGVVGRHLGLLDGRRPQAGDGTAGSATSPHAKIAGSAVRMRSSTRMPRLTCRRAARASAALGTIPAATRKTSAGSARSSSRITSLTRPLAEIAVVEASVTISSRGSM
jgi:hypothetical protein